MSIKIEINKKLNIINKIVEYYKTKNNFYANIDFNKIEISDIYELLDFFENYIINFHMFVYDILSNEIFSGLFGAKKIGVPQLLIDKLDDILRITNNRQVAEKINYIKENSHLINSNEKLIDLVILLKELHISYNNNNNNNNNNKLENLYFIVCVLNKIKNNNYNISLISEIEKFLDTFSLNEKIKKDLYMIIDDYPTINKINELFKKEILYIQENRIIDELISYFDSIKN